MSEVSDIINSNKIILYAFRFGTSDKLVHLTQQQLDRIPYLCALVAHKDDFLLNQNEYGEYVLHHPIEYTWFMPIFRSITSEHPYTLFNEVPEDDNILNTLKLFDFLCIDLFPLPMLKNTSLALSNRIKTDNDENRVVYKMADISEARQTAAEFIIALSKNVYDLHDLYTVDNIFSLIIIIFSHPTVFNSRFRYHTLTVVKECCYSFFSIYQRGLLPSTQKIVKHRKIDSLMYLYDEDKPLPYGFQNTFSWRGAYASKEESSTNCLSTSSTNSLFSNIYKTFSSYWIMLHQYPDLSQYNIQFLDTPGLFEIWYGDSQEKLAICEKKQNRKNNGAQSAGSGRFNKLPIRSEVNHFKRRFGPKSQRYR